VHTLKQYNVFPLLFVVLFFGFSSATQISAQSVADNEENLVLARIAAPSLSNNLLGIAAEQKIAICLPPSYKDAAKRFPTLYFLAGFGDEAAFYTNGMYEGLKMHQSVKELSEGKIICEMIVVVVAGNNFLGSSFYTNSEVGGNWEDYLIKDVIPYVDANYRTVAQPQGRGIAGYWIGGSGALNIIIKYPELFSSVYALSPGVFDKNGLANSQMFTEPQITEKYLKCEKENAALEKGKAHERLVAFCDNTRDLDLIFTLAYGMAFSPNAKKNAPYIDFPYSKSFSKGNLNKEIWKRWENGFGGWDEKIKTMKDNIMKLKSIGIEYGLKDEYKWIIDGCKYLTKLLTAEKIPVKLVSFDGGHQDHLRERIEKFMLPFFSASFESK
jgi:S-formylglutathione hydrolase